MKQFLRAVVVLQFIQLSAYATETGAPFPSSFQLIGPNQFLFVATGNYDYPANTKAGEKERLEWLGVYLAQQHFVRADMKSRSVSRSI